jgi:nucleoside-diphosphate-sugar epimerase
MERHLVTGATGFIGAALVLELIEQTDAEVLCLVRGSAQEPDPEQRFTTAITHAATVYGKEELVEEILSRCRVLPGDITQPLCGVEDLDVSGVEQLWHAAASLAFEDDSEQEILRHNVDGTQAVIDLASRLGVRVFNHVSTAYVAGGRTGRILEELPPLDTETNNAYERSKIRGEHLVAVAPFERVRIFRPSIVIGHSQTYAATTFTGLYGFIRNFKTLRREVSKQLGMFLDHRPIRLVADPTVEMNLIPVDMVARAAVAVSRSDSDERIFHLTNAEPIVIAEGMEVLARAVGIRAPLYVMNREELTSIDVDVDDRLAFYGSYMRSAKVFDHSNVDAAIGSGALSYPLPGPRVEAIVDWYVAYLRANRRPREETLV